MNAPPDRAPEAVLLSGAARRRGITAPMLREKLDNVGVETVRNWLKGYRTVTAGTTVPSSPNPYQLAKLAAELDISPAQLRDVGRDDAADELESVSALSEGGTAAELRYRRPEGISDEQWERIRTRGQAYIDGLIDSAAEER